MNQTLPETAAPQPPPPPPTPTPLFPWTDENAVMSGICFEAAADAAGNIFLLRSAPDLFQFFDLADNSRLCSRPVRRSPFDFTGERLLVGLWSRGRGCTARHDVLNFSRNDEAGLLLIQLRFVTEGTCDYELVQPFWIGVPGAARYEVTIAVE